jgi:hypothetical protein
VQLSSGSSSRTRCTRSGASRSLSGRGRGIDVIARLGQLLLALVPYKGDEFAKFARDYRTLRIEQGRQRLDSAREWVESVIDALGDVDLSARMREEPLLADLLERALEVVLAARDERQVRALREAVVSGATASDSAAVDRELFIVDTVSRLKPAHLRILRRLYLPPALVRRLYQEKMPTVAKQRTRTLHSSIGTDSDTASVLVSQLTREHLVYDDPDNTPNGPESAIRLTSYGKRVCEYLGMGDTDEADDEPR